MFVLNSDLDFPGWMYLVSSISFSLFLMLLLFKHLLHNFILAACFCLVACTHSHESLITVRTPVISGVILARAWTQSSRKRSQSESFPELWLHLNLSAPPSWSVLAMSTGFLAQGGKGGHLNISHTISPHPHTLHHDIPPIETLSEP